MQKRVTYIVSNIDKAIAFEWIVSHLSSNIELSFVLLNEHNSFLENFLKEKGINYIRIPVKGKKSYFISIIKTARFLRKNKTKIVHCHLRDANIIGLTAAIVSRIKTRIYTRHHSTFHLDYFPRAVKIDKLCNRMATDIIAISKNVSDILINKENVPENKIQLIHHGFDLNKFKNPNSSNVEILREKYVQSNSDLVIGIVARYINWKGHSYIIEACKELLQKFPNAHFIFANATGPNQKEIQTILKEKLPQSTYTEIKFENDLFSLYHIFDYYIHTPINSEIEAFGQTYIESMASGTPLICTLSGVGNEIIVHEENALVVPYMDSDSIVCAVTRLINDEKLKLRIIRSAQNSISEFNLDVFVQKLNELYLK